MRVMHVGGNQVGSKGTAEGCVGSNGRWVAERGNRMRR